MNEIELPISAGTSDDALASTSGVAPGVAQPSAGELIRQAREASGLHIAALAVSLKVPVKKLEALEAGRFDLLPDAVFVRALASSVCRSLKIEAGPVLDRLPQTSAPKLTYRGTGINAPFRAPGDGPGPPLWAQVSRPALLWGVVLLLAALVLIMLPSVKKGVTDVRSAVASSGAATPDDSKSAGAGLTAIQEKPEAPGRVLTVTDVPLISASPVVSPSSVPIIMAMSSPSPMSSAPATVVVPAQVTLPVAPASSASALPTASGIVVFSAKSESWVEVTDSRGTVVLRRILAAGEVVGVSGALPLSAVVGRADATQVQIRGKTLDLSPLARDNVARFEVK